MVTMGQDVTRPGREPPLMLHWVSNVCFPLAEVKVNSGN